MGGYSGVHEAQLPISDSRLTVLAAGWEATVWEAIVWEATEGEATVWEVFQKVSQLKLKPATDFGFHP